MKTSSTIFRKTFPKYLCFILIALDGSFFLSAQANKEDSLALVAIYNALDGPNWDSTWTLSDPVSSWYGVTLDHNNRVMFISLYYNNLSGAIPEDIGQLTALSYFNVEYNQITDSFPLSISNLTNLYGFAASNNSISGSIPDTFRNLINLTTFDIDNNQMNGPIPEWIDEWTKLSYFDIRHNSFSGLVPHSLSNLTDVAYLYLNDNDFIGPIPNLENLTKLSSLDIANNNLEGSPDDFLGYHPDLTFINLSGNFMFGSLSNAHFNKDTLESLFVYETLLEDFDDFSSFNLQYVEINNNHLTFEDIIPNVTIENIKYAPQKNVGSPVDTIMNIGDTLSINLHIDSSITTNLYQWSRDETLLGAASNQSELIIFPLTENDYGSYICSISNPAVPGLILESNVFSLGVTTSDSRHNKENVALYPNPFKEQLSIRINDNYHHCIRVIDPLGQEIITIDSFQDLISIPMNRMNPGLFLLIIDDTHSIKILKK